MLRVTRQSARARILAAEKAGAVELFPDPHDRRALQVALTPSGRRALEAHRLPGIAWVFTLLSGLEPSVMEATGNVLRVIRRRLEQHEREMKQARHEAWRRDRR
jgi:DNA-binding MarR family transcriptional regulator